VRALVLCAGYGTRLGELTRALPKAMLPIGPEPLLAHTLRWLRGHGWDDVAINLHHHGELIRETFKDGTSFGVRLSYREEPVLLGTAGALRNFTDFFSGEREILVVYGDLLIDQDLGVLLDTHRNRAAAATLLLHRRTGSNSLVELADDGRITGFLERPSERERAGREGWVNSGVQILSPALLARIPAHGPADLPRDVYAPNVAAERLYGVPLSGYRCAIDSPARYAEARRAFAQGRCQPAGARGGKR
jgi:NDP-sugar pyrophosphorylase family protein